MSTYLLTYNPRNFQWHTLAEDAEKSASGVTKRHRWNARHKDITTGNRVFLLKQGQGKTGIMAAGRVTSEPFFDDHWHERARVGAQARYVHVEFERILNPTTERLLSVADRKEHLATLYLDTRFSGRHIPDDAAEELEKLWSQHLERHGLIPKSIVPKSTKAIELLRVNPPKRVLKTIQQRQGQGDFRQDLLRAYGRRCCITKCNAEPALEAAHIIGYAQSGSQDTRCGLLLRADVHTLFDLGLLRINPETMRVVLSDALKGTSYGDLDGRRITLPENPADNPTAALERKWKASAE